MIRARIQQQKMIHKARYIRTSIILACRHNPHAQCPILSNVVRSLSSSSPQQQIKQQQEQEITSSTTKTRKQILKEEAQKAHQMRQRQEQQLAHERQRQRQRAEAAKSLGPLLRMSPICFQDTIAALDLSTLTLDLDNHTSIHHGTKIGNASTTSARVSKLNQNDDYQLMQQNMGLNLQYRQLYMKSITSFINSLREINGSNNEQHLSKPSESTEALLEQLVQCGFDNGQFAKQYRKMKLLDISTAKLQQKINQKQKELNTRFERRRASQNAFSNAQHEFEKKKQERKLLRLAEQTNQNRNRQEDINHLNHDDTTTYSWVQSIINLFSNQTSSSSNPNDYSISSDSSKSKSLSSSRKLRIKAHKEDVSNMKIKQNKVKESYRLVQATENSILRLESEMDYYQINRTIPWDQYVQVDEVMKQVLKELCPYFANHIQQRHAELVKYYRHLDSMTDLTKPHEWYRQARKMKRTFIFHGGNTNSGKTYTALQRLKEVETGLYLGPLRLLAAEVYENMTEAGVPTNLYTGQEYIETPDATHISATAEICPTNKRFDVVVIDEIQMIGDPSRGHAWTRALQGIQSKEIHLCGGMEALPIVEKIVEDCNDKLVVKPEYRRFSNLHVSDYSWEEEHGDSGYKMVEPGDCIVAFSRNDIFTIKREIESNTQHKCSVIYGSLPPEIRLQQAHRFNDKNSDQKILIASDAIGMGLNLHIKRIIFNSMLKSDGEKIIQLPHTNVKQISGRAGRRNSPYPDGVVTCRNPDDLEYLQNCMSTDVPELDGAGLLPSSSSIQEFSNALSTIKEEYDDLYTVLQKFSEMATVQGDFFVCRQTAIFRIAKYLADVPLSLTDKYTFCMAPVKIEDHQQMKALKEYAYSLSKGEIRGIKSSGTPKLPRSFEDISRLCAIHNELELFMWLCYRFPEHFLFEQSALALQERTISFINEGLVNSDDLQLDHCYKVRDVRLRKNFENRKEMELLDDDSESDDVFDDTKYYQPNSSS